MYRAISVEAKRSAAGSCANINYPCVILFLSPSSGFISSPTPLPLLRFLHCSHPDFVWCSPLFSFIFVFTFEFYFPDPLLLACPLPSSFPVVLLPVFLFVLCGLRFHLLIRCNSNSAASHPGLLHPSPCEPPRTLTHTHTPNFAPDLTNLRPLPSPSANLLSLSGCQRHFHTRPSAHSPRLPQPFLLAFIFFFFLTLLGWIGFCSFTCLIFGWIAHWFKILIKIFTSLNKGLADVQTFKQFWTKAKYEVHWMFSVTHSPVWNNQNNWDNGLIFNMGER